MSSYQDLPKPDCSGINHHNQANDLDKSYVFVPGVDSLLRDDEVNNKDVVLEGSSVSAESEAAVEDQGAELDAVSGNAGEPLNEGDNWNPERSKVEHETSLEDGDGVQGSIANSQEEHNGETDCLAEAEIKQVEDPNGKIESSAVVAIEMVGNRNGKIEGLAQDEQEKVETSLEDGDGVQVSIADSQEEHNGKTDSWAEAEIKQVEDPNVKIETSAEVATEMVGDQNGKIEGVAEDEREEVEDVIKSECTIADQDGKIEGVAEGEQEKVEDLIVSESPVADQNRKIDAVAEGEQEKVEDLIESESTIADKNGKIEGEAEGEKEKVEDLIESESTIADQNGKIEGVAEGEKERVEDLIKSVSTDEKEKVEDLIKSVSTVGDQNGKIEGVIEGEQEKAQDLIESVSSPHPVENQESRVGAVGSVAESGVNGGSNNSSSHMDKSGNANDECEDQINLSAIGTTEACQGSLQVIVDVVECELQDVSEVGEDKVRLGREAVEAAEHGVPPPTSFALDLEPYPVNNKEQTLEEEAKTALSLDVTENQKSDTALGNGVQGVLEHIGEAKTVVSSTDSHMETVCDLVLEEKNNENFFASHGGGGVRYPEEPDKHPDGNGVSSETMLSETKTEDSAPTQSFLPSNAHEPQTEIEMSDAENTGAVSFSPVDGPKSQIIENGYPGHDGSIRCTSDEAISDSDSLLDRGVGAENEPTFQGGEAHAETVFSSGNTKVANSTPATFDVKLEPEVHVHNFSAISSGETASDVTVTCRTEVLDSFDVNNEGASNTLLETEDVEDMGDQLDCAAGSSSNNLILQENKDTGNSHSDNVSVASPESFCANMNDGEEMSIKTKTKPFNLLIRIPKFDDESLKEQIRLAKLHVDEKTKLRDAIQFQIQEKRANSQIHGVDYEYAKGEARRARKLVRSKRMEIDSLQSVINKAKNASSIEDIDSQISHMEHMIQHETLPLKEEKQLIREIKQLKQLREQLSSNMGSQDEIKQALEQREEVEKSLKILRTELDILKGGVLKAEASAVEAERKYDDENKKIKELQAQFRAADEVRQTAYFQWQGLRKEFSKKNKHFFKYKDDAAVASNYAFNRDTEALYQLCMNQVETFMELWNTNDEFRKEYVRYNARSTVRRLGTLDGRSLGPDEKPPVLPTYVNERVDRMVSTPAKDDLASQIPTLELKQESTVKDVTSDDKSMKKVTEHKNQKVTNEGPAKPLPGNGLDTVPLWGVTDNVHEEPKKSREEVELMRKAEETRREEAEAKLREERRLEGLAKANEARERKKRQAEKVQLRAELKTQKEAELKEKEREKRLRKKERKKAAATDVNDTNNNCETAPNSESTMEIGKDIEVKDTSSAITKKPQKPWLFTKQSKTKSVPPPLRNRNKKKWQQWMWVGFTSVAILVLFWLGNLGVFSNVNLKRRSPVL